MAPELVKKRKKGERYEYDPFKCDMWSLGVTFYYLLTNRLPFNASTPEEMRVCLRNESLQPSPLPDHVDPFWQQTIPLLLQREPSRRITAA